MALSVPMHNAGVTSIALTAGGASMLAMAFSVPVPKASCCAACGYDLQATQRVSPMCPECGATGSALQEGAAVAARGRRGRLMGWAALMLVGGAAFGAMSIAQLLG